MAPKGTRRLLDGLFALDRLLRHKSHPTLKELAAYVGANARTVQRYIETMRDRLGAEVIYDPGLNGYRYADSAFEMPTARLTDDEILALYVAEPILAQYRGTPLEDDFARAFAHLTAALPEKVRAQLAPVTRRISARAPAPARPDPKIFPVLMRATLGSKQLSITYFSAHRGASSVRVVDPYALRCVGGRWYVLAYCHERQAVLPFLLLRVWSAAVTGKSFTPPPDFDPEQHLKHALGIFRAPLDREDGGRPFEAVLHFDRVAAPYVREMEWHGSQESRALERGGLEIRLTLESSVELERFVLEWGEHVVVLEPQDLRDRLALRLAAALARYHRAPDPAQPQETIGDQDRDTA